VNCSGELVVLFKQGVVLFGPGGILAKMTYVDVGGWKFLVHSDVVIEIEEQVVRACHIFEGFVAADSSWEGSDGLFLIAGYTLLIKRLFSALVFAFFSLEMVLFLQKRYFLVQKLQLFPMSFLKSPTLFLYFLLLAYQFANFFCTFGEFCAKFEVHIFLVKETEVGQFDHLGFVG
jgi:hypothetical protein